MNQRTLKCISQSVYVVTMNTSDSNSDEKSMAMHKLLPMKELLHTSQPIGTPTQQDNLSTDILLMFV